MEQLTVIKNLELMEVNFTVSAVVVLLLIIKL